MMRCSISSTVTSMDTNYHPPNNRPFSLRTMLMEWKTSIVQKRRNQFSKRKLINHMTMEDSNESSWLHWSTNIKCLTLIGNKLGKVLQWKYQRLMWTIMRWKLVRATYTFGKFPCCTVSMKLIQNFYIFSFMLNNERFENILNLFGCVDAKYTAHEVRGLCITVRLKKTIKGVKWPRLVQSPDKNRLIKCNDDFESSDEESGKNPVVNEMLPFHWNVSKFLSKLLSDSHPNLWNDCKVVVHIEISG